MSAGPDVSHAPELTMLAEKPVPNGSGTLARLLELDATRRQQRALSMLSPNSSKALAENFPVRLVATPWR